MSPMMGALAIYARGRLCAKRFELPIYPVVQQQLISPCVLRDGDFVILTVQCEETQEILLEHRIEDSIEYSRQGGTIITWCDPPLSPTSSSSTSSPSPSLLPSSSLSA
jgi:hypothetical protein